MQCTSNSIKTKPCCYMVSLVPAATSPHLVIYTSAHLSKLFLCHSSKLILLNHENSERFYSAVAHGDEFYISPKCSFAISAHCLSSSVRTLSAFTLLFFVVISTTPS